VSSPGQVLARVDKELRAFWTTAPAPGEPPRARACTMNLVVVAGPEIAERWVPIVDDVAQGTPARVIVVGLDPDGPDGLDATTSAVCTRPEAGGTAICSERVTLSASGTVCARVPSCVDALCTTDVPTTLVWLGRVHADDPVFAPLARDAARVVLDAGHGSLMSLAHVVRWARGREKGDRPGVADLAWTRIAPWQELCARMFDEPRLRPLADRVTRVRIVQGTTVGAALTAEGALLLGWLATRLGWKATSLAGKLRLVHPDETPVIAQLVAEPAAQAPEGAILSVSLEAAEHGLAMRGEVTRDRESGADGAATWRLEVTAGADTQRIEQHVRLRALGAARLLERTLRRPPQDDALAESAAWADELRGEELACG
jgi:glucose-6-phosphate dehydrogenase assembly protein OpcA